MVELMTVDVAAEAAALLATHPDYRVLKRFVPRTRYVEEPWDLGERSPARRGLFADVEGTGLDTERDEIIEIGLQPFTYDPTTGRVFDVLDGYSAFEQPTIPLSPETEEITGISAEMVKGHRIDDAAVTALVKESAIVIAHSARYDRPMLERRFPVFATVPWACSQSEIPWRQFGVAGGALANILMSACGEFTEDAHRALADCQVGVHVLATAEGAGEGRTGLSYLLESARQPTRRVCAIGAPRETKDLLRARGYHALYRGGRFGYWYKDMREHVEEEMEWCRKNAYAEPQVHTLTARERYSCRAD